MADLVELRALRGRAREIAFDKVRRLSNEIDAVTTDDPDEEEAIRALLEAVGDMTVALLPRVEPEQITEAGLKQLMRDPRYWKYQDPEIVEKVRAGFRKLYQSDDWTVRRQSLLGE